MKSINILIMLASLCCSLTKLSAQTFEGKTVMKMEALALPPEMESMRSMMESSITTYYKGKVSRTETTNPMTGKMFIISDMEKGEVVMCMDMMGQKKAVVSSLDEMKNQSHKDGQKKPEYKATGETKMIAGYKCEQMTLTMNLEKGGTSEMEIWVTKEIPNTNLEYSDVPGMMMEYTIEAEKMKLHFITTEVSKEKVDDSLFVVPSDFVRTTKAELQQSMGGK